MKPMWFQVLPNLHNNVQKNLKSTCSISSMEQDQNFNILFDKFNSSFICNLSILNNAS
jgi:hypothetical protein